MSTITHKSKVSNRKFVDAQIRATRRTLKLVDLFAGILTLTLGLLVFLFIVALLEHWVIPGGWSQTARNALFILMMAGVAWYGWRTFWPLLRKSINPIYAAQTLEKSSPSLKSSLLSLLLFRGHRRQLTPTVYQAIEQQAAVRLAQIPIDTAVDRSAVLRLGYTLVVVVAIFALYRVLSPKNPFTSASRVLIPWSTIRVPSRVQILDIHPGDTSVARGERLIISAEVHGLDEDEPVILHYRTTMDGENTIDWQPSEPSGRLSIPMLATPSDAPANLKRQCQLSDASHDGVEQNVRYWIEAGDARSATYQVHVFARPTMVVKRVRYDFPAYTGYPSREVVTTGDLDALEGTRITLTGISNQPIQKAFVDFDADGHHDMAMQISADSKSKDRAQAQFPLSLRPDRRTPLHSSYVLRFTTTLGRANRHPPKYRIAVTPDYAPEIRLTGSPEEIVHRSLDKPVTVELEASDPDFALSKVRVVGYLEQAGINPQESPTEETKRLERILLSKNHTGRFLGQTWFTPRQLDLHEGDVLIYWAEARDNRTPEANVSTTSPRRVQVARSQSSDSSDTRQPGKSQDDPDRPAAGTPPADPASDSADNDRTVRQQPQDADDSGQHTDGDAGGSSGGEGAGGESAGDDGAAGGQDTAGENGQRSETQGGEPAGESTAGSQNAGNTSDTSSDQAGAGENSPDASDPGANTNDSSADPAAGGGDQNQPGESPGGPANDQEQPGSGQPESGQGQHDSGQEKVSPEGDDDGSAFDRLREHFAEQAANQKQPAQQDDDSGQQASPDKTSDAQGESQDRAQDGQPASPKDQSAQNQQESQGESHDDAQDGKAQERQPGSQQDPSGQGQQGAQGSHGETEQDSAADDDQADSQQATESEPSGDSGEMSPDQGTAGAGDDLSDEQTAPESQASRKPRDQQAGGNDGKTPDDPQPPSVRRDQQQSDTQGGQGGDRSGAGKEGAGGQAGTEGTGSAGQHETADDGSGQSAEPGTGQAGTQPGGTQPADSQTGQSSQNQPGEGSESGGQSGKQARDQQPHDDQSKRQPEQQAGEKPESQDSSRANPEDTQGTSPAANGGQPGQPTPGQTSLNEPNPNETDQTGGQSSPGSSSQNGGGDGGSDRFTPPGAEQEAQEGDAANLEYAHQQTDLILNRLSDQLNRARVDPKLLNKLGWSPQELQRFVNRWKNLKSLAAGTGDQAQAAQAELNAALRSLGLRKDRHIRYDSTHAKDNLRDLRDTYRGRVPADYLERVRAYVKGTATQE
jgi:hypothetical protein